MDNVATARLYIVLPPVRFMRTRLWLLDCHLVKLCVLEAPRSTPTPTPTPTIPHPHPHPHPHPLPDQ